MENLKIGKMSIGMCATNCYFIYRENENKVLLIDPPDKGEHIINSLKENQLEVAAVLLTHAHFDHIYGVEEVKKLANVKVYASENEKDICESADLNVSNQVSRPCVVHPDAYLKDGEMVEIAGIKFQLIETPGHTKGSSCYYFEEAGFLVSGDTLFQDSVGRSDLPTGSMSELIRSIKNKLFVLPENVKVYPGHGDSTTIGHEKKYNAFCQ